MSGPLEGKRGLITRAKTQASELAEKLEALGATSLILPSIEFEALVGEDRDRLDDAIRCSHDYDAIVLTSVRGVSAIENRLEVLGTAVAEVFASRKLIAVGNVTAAALAKAVRQPDIVPVEFSASGILSELGYVAGQRFLLLRADEAKDDLPRGLVARGATVDDVTAYRILPTNEQLALDGQEPDILTFTSSKGVMNTYEKLSRAGLTRWLEEIPIVCIGPVTANTVLELRYEVAAVAKEATIDSLVQTVVELGSRMEISHV